MPDSTVPSSLSLLCYCCHLLPVLFCCSLLSLQILPCAAILHFSHFFKPSMHITYTVTRTWNSELYFNHFSAHLSFLLIVAYDLMQVLITMTYEYWSTKFIVVLYEKFIANCLSVHLQDIEGKICSNVCLYYRCCRTQNKIFTAWW